MNAAEKIRRDIDIYELEFFRLGKILTENEQNKPKFNAAVGEIKELGEKFKKLMERCEKFLSKKDEINPGHVTMVQSSFCVAEVLKSRIDPVIMKGLN